MEPSILKSIKKVLGIGPEYTAFDADILMHINSVFSTLHQLGIGPDTGFFIENEHALWSTFLQDDARLNSVKTYMFLRVRLLFDPPGLSFVIDAMQKQIQELEWRLNVQREGDAWTSPTVVTTTLDEW
jgi:hypothetical protein